MFEVFGVGFRGFRVFEVLGLGVFDVFGLGFWVF